MEKVMPATKVKTDWTDGNLNFKDDSGNIIATWDGTNRKLTFPSGSELELASGAAIDLEGLTNGSPGAGISGGTGTVFKSSVIRTGGIIRTSLLIDLTGLASSTTDLDIIGQSTTAAYLGQITAARNGTIISGRMTCLEVPTGGADDIDLYSATEATGVFDGGIAALAETALVTSAGAWTLGGMKALSAVPAANEYLYLTGGEGGTANTYTAGKFLIELDGYVA
jgi:hypothetical protein